MTENQKNELEFLTDLNHWAEGRGLHRDQKQVLGEYEPGWASWSGYLDACQTIQEWLFRKDADFCPNNRLGETYSSAYQDTMTPKLKYIDSVIEHYFKDSSTIVEAGCGIGRNIHYLAHRYPGRKFIGLELTESGVQVAKKASQRFQLQAEFQHFDFVSRQNVGQDLLGTADVVFTCFALEQISSGIDIAMERLLRISNKGLVHIEPVPELYPPSLGGTITAKMHKRADYLKDFIATVLRLVQQRRVTIEYMGPALFPIHAAHYPSLVVLKKFDAGLSRSE